MQSSPYQQPNKHRNDPGRFFGDGVTFKAKLIGILEVGEARGDKMCQEALQDLKMAIRAAGEHKQRITIHVTIDGLRLRDEKSSDSLYHHPVHKISFIAQDMSDSRAFGYIFGSPDSGHRFFGIKTDKAASQVVLAMRDLFQVVFELKKKEIELARQHIQSKTIHEHQPVTLNIINSSMDSTTSGATYNKLASEPSTSKLLSKEISPESVADLVDLEQELSSIQRGITQMEQITPSDTQTKITSEEDPFGDSFTKFPAYNLLPPPESSKSRHSKPLKPPDDLKPCGPVQPLPIVVTSITTAATVLTTTTTTVPCLTSTKNDWLSTSEATTVSTASMSSATFDESKPIGFEDNATLKDESQLTDKNSSSGSTSEQYIDAFTDLDPLGTGKIKPYIDKKYFFQDLKNPPKKVLKDLSEQDSVFSANFGTNGNNVLAGGMLASTSINKEEDKIPFDSSHPIDPGNELSPVINNSSNSKTIANNCTKDTDFTPNFSRSTATFSNQSGIFNIEHKTDDPIIGNNKALLVADNDPFSPRMKKFDPFDDDFAKASLDPFDFEFVAKQKSTTILPDTKITTSSTTISGSDDKQTKIHIDKKIADFNGPLQVHLPPEGYTSYMSQQQKQQQLERHNSESTEMAVTGRNRPSVFKQNTVDVINSISTKKMKPHLFSQKYTKRDSNSINMRRLQESDSLSETETAPEPPPRPDTMSHVEPPPLPPKKQFSDIVIRPRVTSPLAISVDSTGGTRYDYVAASLKSQLGPQNENSPAIPLPSRKVARTDSNTPGPNRPAKKISSKDDDDYLTPISGSGNSNELPILLPPPQNKGTLKHRGRRHPEPIAVNPPPSSSPVVVNQPVKLPEQSSKNISINLPDITLSQLLTLGIDELATKLNVPTNKLSTMNIMELTKYLSDFIENTTKPTPPSSDHQQQQEVAIFKVSFDESTDATFIAKFDDNFGEDDSSFVPDFEQFNLKPESQAHPLSSSTVTTVAAVDKYAVFREIMEQELKSEDDDVEQQNDLNSSIGSEEQNSDNDTNVIEEPRQPEPPVQPLQIQKIDTKITEVIAQAKDRYAALRDIILVEDLFDKSTHLDQNPSIEFRGDDNEPIDENKQENDNSSMEINISVNLDDNENTPTGPSLINLPKSPTPTTKDDLEINEYMNRALSNLSLDSRDHLSPQSTAKSPVLKSQNASTSPICHKPQTITPTIYKETSKIKTTLNDMSTSPIPLQKSASRSPIIQRSPLNRSPIDQQIQNHAKSPIPNEVAVLIDAHKRVNSDSQSDAVCGSSPEIDKNIKSMPQPQAATPVSSETWATFDQPTLEKPKDLGQLRSPRSPRDDNRKGVPESPCSSDDKADWKVERTNDGGKRWARGQTSSSSRDVSPWDDDNYNNQHRIPSSKARHEQYYMRHGRRLTSGDDDYDYEEEMGKRRIAGSGTSRQRTIKSGMTRSREDFDGDGMSWFLPTSNHHSWSPPDNMVDVDNDDDDDDDDDDDNIDRNKMFERSSYERSTYGPPYEKREHSADRKDYCGKYDKRKYYNYTRPDYDFDNYGEIAGSTYSSKDRKISYYDDYEQRVKGRKDYDDDFLFESNYSSRDGNRNIHGGKINASKDYFHDRDKRSFDRESMESYDSTGRRRKQFGSGDMYGSLESQEEFRERYTTTSDRMRSFRKGGSAVKQRSNEEYDQDSDGGEMTVHRGPGDTRSLQRPAQGSRIRKSSGSSPWDGEDLTPTSQKSWRRPASASESDRKMLDNNRRGLTTHTLPGSDGEKDRRFRKKLRTRGKEIDYRSNYATIRHIPSHRNNELNYDDYIEDSYRCSGTTPRRKLDSTRSLVQEPSHHQHQFHHHRSKDNFEFDRTIIMDNNNMQKFSKSNRDIYYHTDREQYLMDTNTTTSTGQSSAAIGGKSKRSTCKRLDSDDYDDYDDDVVIGGVEKTPRSTSKNKFNNFDHDEPQGFESDFNSPSNNGKSLRFSNDFSAEKESPRQLQPPLVHTTSHHSLGAITNPNASECAISPSASLAITTPLTAEASTAAAAAAAITTTIFASSAQKLRFDDKIVVSKFNQNADMFDDDDFSKANFSFETDDQWIAQMPKKTLKSMKHSADNIKKSESVNIFGKAHDDPFEDDDFFKETTKKPNGNGNNGSKNNISGSHMSQQQQQHFKWENNFAKFDENI